MRNVQICCIELGHQYLDPDHHRVPNRTGRVPGDLEQSRVEKEHHPGIVRRAKLPQMARPKTRNRAHGTSGACLYKFR
jgi:hypothetical protein